MRRVMIKKFISIALITVFSSSWACANVGAKMQDFWNGMGGYSNVSGAGAYDMQSAGYYSMGGLYARTPVKNVQLANISLPSLSAGCGGINIYNGGLSFINSEKITELLKAIANNAQGFAFQLALETMSPVIAEKIEELQTWIQRINALNINSCEAAATLVGGVWPRHDQASKTICSTLSGSSGVATDYVEARHGCQTNHQKATDGIRKGNEAEADRLMVEDINIAWKAIKDSKLLSQEGSDKTLAELFMTLSGTIIVHAPKNDKDQPKFEYISAQATSNEVITTLLDGGNIKYHVCDESKSCLNINQNSGTHKISETQAFKAKIEKLIASILDKIKSDTPLNEEEKGLINTKSRIPLYKILNVYAAYSGSGALFELSAYSEAIALQILFEYLDNILSKVEQASNSLMIADEDHIQKFKEDIREARKVLANREIKTHQNYATLMSLVDKAMVVEGMLSKNIGSPLADAFQWSKKY